MIASLVAFFLSEGFTIKPIIPKLSEINEMATSTLKFMFDGNNPVKGIKRKEIVAKIPESAMNRKPNSRPQDTIQVVLPPNLSPSISGISKLLMNINCNNITGREKIKKGRSSVPIMVK